MQGDKHSRRRVLKVIYMHTSAVKSLNKCHTVLTSRDWSLCIEYSEHVQVGLDFPFVMQDVYQCTIDGDVELWRAETMCGATRKSNDTSALVCCQGPKLCISKTRHERLFRSASRYQSV
jgi:hypothetical protein